MGKMLIGIVALVIILGAVLVFRWQYKKLQFLQYVAFGEQYYSEGNYEEALLVYKKADHIKTTPEVKERIRMIQEAWDTQQHLPLSPRTRKKGEPFKHIGYVKIDAVGTITFNDHPISLKELSKEFATLHQLGGAVRYYRANPEGAPPPNAMDVVQAIHDARLPVNFSSKPDFSDALDGEGRSVSRQKQDVEPTYFEPDGEGSYANCLLVTLAKGPQKIVTIVEGEVLPDLATLSSDEPHEQAWIARLPFNYQTLKASHVIDILSHAADLQGDNTSETSAFFRPRLALPHNQSQYVTFHFSLSTTPTGIRTLHITKHHLSAIITDSSRDDKSTREE